MSLVSIQIILKDILITLKFLKDNGVIHCDLKPENILLKKNETNNVKLIDFGSAIFIDDSVHHYDIQTLPYRAPEIIIGLDFHYAIDMYSLGCILYELITHKILFNDKPIKNLAKAMAINKIFNLSFLGDFKAKNNILFKELLIVLSKS